MIFGREDPIGSEMLYKLASDFWEQVIDDYEFSIDWADCDDLALGFVEAALVASSRMR